MAGLFRAPRACGDAREALRLFEALLPGSDKKSSWKKLREARTMEASTEVKKARG